MPDQQPTDVAMRLARIGLESVGFTTDMSAGSRQDHRDVALALDAAGIQLAVEGLEYAAKWESKSSCKTTLLIQMEGYRKVCSDVLELLRGEFDAK